MTASATAGQTSGTPTPQLPEYMGSFPVDRPDYAGVEQILFLSNQWAVVVTSTLDEVVDEIDELSGGLMRPAVDRWDATKATDRKDWAARRTVTALRDEYLALARINAEEDLLDDTTSYLISSSSDSRYRTARAPARVGRTLVGLGDTRVTGGPSVDYVHYSYINFPEPLRNGNRYTIEVRGGKRVSFRYHTNYTVSRAIKVNQVGYVPDAPRKVAYLGAYIYDHGPMDCSAYTHFQVVSTHNGAVAYTGDIRLREKSARIKKGGESGPLLNGEDVYELDFTDMTATGEFFIQIPGVGRSWPFMHSPDAYGEAFYTATRGLYHQRCGIASEAPYSNWPRIRCHTEPVHESELVAFGKGEFDIPVNYERFDIIGATIDRTKSTNAQGGWHDAADWDKNNAHYTVIFDLLNAYEIAPEKFTDGQLNIPESGNGVPDILDEAAYGLKVWRSSLNAAGGASGFVETYTHPAIEVDGDYAFARRTRWDSLLFAAAAAQLAQHMRPFAGRDAARWEWYARKAYNYGNNPDNSLGSVTMHARKNRGKGAPYTVKWEEKDEFITPFLLFARVRLYRLSSDRRYLDGLDALLEEVRAPFKWPYDLRDYSPWIYFGLLFPNDGTLSPEQREQLMETHFLDYADELVDYLEGVPYRRSWPRNQDFWMTWGSSVMTNPARALFIAHALSGDDRYRDAAILNVDFMLGANPMGMSWTTGLGYTYPVNFQHEMSEKDGIADPVPGITLYGMTGGMYGALRNEVWHSPGGVLGSAQVEFKVPEVPLWRTWSAHTNLNTRQCEFTIQETMSSTIFCTAMLLDDGWMPSSPLKARTPRPAEALHGYWYLP